MNEIYLHKEVRCGWDLWSKVDERANKYLRMFLYSTSSHKSRWNRRGSCAWDVSFNVGVGRAPVPHKCQLRFRASTVALRLAANTQIFCIEIAQQKATEIETAMCKSYKSNPVYWTPFHISMARLIFSIEVFLFDIW